MRRDKAQMASELVSSARQQAAATDYETPAKPLNGANGHVPASVRRDEAAEPEQAPVVPASPVPAPAPAMASAYGFPIPREVTEAERQVQLAVRIPELLRWAVRMASLMQGVEMQDLVRLALEEKLERLAGG